MTDEEWLNATSEIGDARPNFAAKVLHSIADTLQEAPPDKRYDIEITVNEQ